MTSAAREFLDSGLEIANFNDIHYASAEDEEVTNEDIHTSTAVGYTALLKQASPERIRKCNIEGLEIAEALLGRAQQTATPASADNMEPASDSAAILSGKGGSWTYTIGLVGKPSAGTSWQLRLRFTTTVSNSII